MPVILSFARNSISNIMKLQKLYFVLSQVTLHHDDWEIIVWREYRKAFRGQSLWRPNYDEMHSTDVVPHAHAHGGWHDWWAWQHYAYGDSHTWWAWPRSLDLRIFWNSIPSTFRTRRIWRRLCVKVGNHALGWAWPSFVPRRRRLRQTVPNSGRVHNDVPVLLIERQTHLPEPESISKISTCFRRLRQGLPADASKHKNVLWSKIHIMQNTSKKIGNI